MPFSGLTIPGIPVLSDIYIEYLSALSIRDSFKKREAPCPNKLSRSISPILKPPPAARPPTGCLESIVIGPVALENIFLAT